MDADIHARASDLLNQLLEAPEELRPTLLDEWIGDAVVRTEVRRLMAHYDEAFLAQPLQFVRAFLGDPDSAGTLPRPFGPFRLLRLLGSGGMGHVFEAEQPVPKRRVALKLLRSQTLSPDAHQQLPREAQCLATLQHPGITQVYEAGCIEHAEGAQLYVAMELVRGQPLDAYVREHATSLHDRLELFLKICDAVEHAHQHGIIHRDLKPQNVLIDERANPHVLDFGIARVTNSDLQVATFRMSSGQVLGTLPYMSPEQALGRCEDMDLRSDLYTLGVMLHELVCGELPYAVRDKPLEAVLRTIREQAPVPLRRCCHGLSRDLELIVLKCLQKDRAQRYSAVAELSLDLQRYLNREPIHARHTTLFYRAKCFAQRNRWLVTWSLLLIGALSAGIAGTSFGLLRAVERERDFHLLADLKSLQALEDESRAFGAAAPANLSTLQAWITRGEAVVARRTEHARALTSLLERAHGTPDDPQFEDPFDAWWYASMVALSEAVARFGAERPRIHNLAEVRRLHQFAATVRKRTFEDAALAWRHATAAIADRTISPAYDGLVLDPQLGLLPLGLNLRTGLWEFAHIQSGPPATFDSVSGAHMTEGAGIVLVLLPGGAFQMGAQRRDPNATLYDPEALNVEGPPIPRRLAPFFLSKFEMTIDQWWRLTGTSPAFYLRDIEEQQPDARADPLHPVENITWSESTVLLARLGLELPTEAQWEYAARAGYARPFGSIARREDLAKYANLSDQTAQRANGDDSWPYESDLDDGHWIHARVGSFEANEFGIFDLRGNVAEWCRDQRPSYNNHETVVWGDGYMNEISARRIVRGGSFASSASSARSSARRIVPDGHRNDDVGLRPVRALDGQIFK